MKMPFVPSGRLTRQSQVKHNNVKSSNDQFPASLAALAAVAIMLCGDVALAPPAISSVSPNGAVQFQGVASGTDVLRFARRSPVADLRNGRRHRQGPRPGHRQPHLLRHRPSDVDQRAYAISSVRARRIFTPLRTIVAGDGPGLAQTMPPPSSPPLQRWEPILAGNRARKLLGVL